MRKPKPSLAAYGPAGYLLVSNQVLQEFYVVTTRKLEKPVRYAEAADIVEELAGFPMVQINTVLISRAMTRHQAGSFSFSDSLIVEAALQTTVRYYSRKIWRMDTQ